MMCYLIPHQTRIKPDIRYQRFFKRKIAILKNTSKMEKLSFGLANDLFKIIYQIYSRVPNERPGTLINFFRNFPPTTSLLETGRFLDVGFFCWKEKRMLF